LSREEIIGKVEDFRESGLPEYIRRTGTLLRAELMVSIVIGARRAGKSFRVQQAADELLKTNTIASIRHICILDFDNPILAAEK
jgi:type II secretory pathway predicted ATPase ExeA